MELLGRCVTKVYIRGFIPRRGGGGGGGVLEEFLVIDEPLMV